MKSLFEWSLSGTSRLLKIGKRGAQLASDTSGTLLRSLTKGSTTTVEVLAPIQAADHASEESLPTRKTILDRGKGVLYVTGEIDGTSPPIPDASNLSQIYIVITTGGGYVVNELYRNSLTAGSGYSWVRLFDAGLTSRTIMYVPTNLSAQSSGFYKWSGTNYQKISGSGGGFSSLLAGFDQSLYTLVTEILFDRDQVGIFNLLINAPNTTASGSGGSYKFLDQISKIISLDLTSPAFVGRAKSINRASVVLEWAQTKVDPISHIRLSKNGGQSFELAKHFRSGGIVEGVQTIITEYPENNRDSSVSINITNQITLGGSFIPDKNASINKIYVNLKRVGSPNGRAKLYIYSDNLNLPSSKLGETAWFNISDIGNISFSNYEFELLLDVFVGQNTQYHVVMIIESSDGYLFNSGVSELQWGSDSSVPTGGLSSRGDGSIFSSLSGSSFIFGIIGKEVLTDPINVLGYGEVTFTKNTHYNKNIKLVDNLSGDDSDIILNSTTQQKLAEIVKFDKSIGITTISIKGTKVLVPGGQLECEIYSDLGGSPSSLLYTSVTKYNANSVISSITFKFDNIELSAGTYHISISGINGYAPDGLNYVAIRADVSSSTYLSGIQGMSKYDGTSWSSVVGTTMVFNIEGAYQDESVLATYEAVNETTNFGIIDDGTAFAARAQAIPINNNAIIKQIGLSLKRTGTPGGTCFVEVYTDNGTPGKPLTKIATSEPINIDDIPITQEEILFSFTKEFSRNQKTWVALQVSGYSYVATTDELGWALDATTPIHQGGNAIYVSGVWTDEGTPTHIYSVYGIESDLIVEISGKTINSELNGFALWYAFQDAYVTADPSQAVIQLDSNIQASGAIPISPIIADGGVNLIIGTHVLTEDDFILSGNIIYLPPSELVGVNKVTVQKRRIGQHFGMPQLEINDRLRALPSPRLNRFDQETIEITADSGANAVKVELPNGVILTGSAGARVSFNATKNKWGGMAPPIETNNTEYYIYGAQQAGTTNALGYIISSVKPSSGGPTGYRYWKYLGRIWNDSSGDIVYPFTDTVELDVWNSNNIASYIARFTELRKSYGSLLTFTDSSIVGNKFTANADGRLSVTYITVADTTLREVGISKNGNHLLPITADPTKIIAWTNVPATYGVTCSTSILVVAGDYVQAHNQTDFIPLNPSRCGLSITLEPFEKDWI